MPKSTALFMKRGLRKAIEFYFKIHYSWPVWFYVINRKPRTLFKSNPPTLNAVQSRLVHDLNEKGIAVTTLQELFPDRPHLLAEFRQYVLEKAKERKDVPHLKPFLKYLWDEIPVVSLSDPFHRLIIDERIINVVNSYVGMFTNFYHTMLNITIPAGTDSKAVLSQRWHRDLEDKKLCKIFLYLNDVDEKAGPFTYIPYSKYGTQWGHLFPQQPPKGAYPPRGELEKVIPYEAIVKMTGRAGTLIFCDTSGLHRGGYAFSKERIMLTAGYRTRASATDNQVIKDDIQLGNTSPGIRYAVDSEVPIAISRIMFGAYRKLSSKKVQMD